MDNPDSPDRGAALVEFALLMPLLVLLLVGIAEFGWLMSQQNDVRHGAREAARLAASNSGSVASMGAAVCGAMDSTTGAVVSFTDPGAVGSRATVSVVVNVTPLTGFPGVTSMMPATLGSTVNVSIEQPTTLWATGNHTC